MHTYPYHLHGKDTLVEIVDAEDRPLLLLQREEAQRQGLCRREIRIILRGARGRILLMRRPLPNGGYGQWTLPGDRVRAGEAREDAALRLLEQGTGSGPALWPGKELQTAVDGARITLFYCALPQESLKNIEKNREERMFLDKDELLGLRDHFPELLHAELLALLEGDALWASAKSARRD